MPVLAVLDDLLFRSKLEAAARQKSGVVLRVADDTASLKQLLPTAAWRLVIVDLDLSSQDPLEIVKIIRQEANSSTLLGYCSHVHVELMARAKDAGCHFVWSRAEFVNRLPQVLAGTFPGLPRLSSAGSSSSAHP